VTDAAPDLPPLPAQPAGVPWPTADWPTGPLPPGATTAVEAVVAEAFGPGNTPDGPLGLTLALLAVHRGRLVLEAYGPDTGPDTPLISWSMAKSITHAAVGMLVGDGLLDPAAPAPVAEWAADERGAITLADLLAMRGGQHWVEEYVWSEGDPTISHVIDMLFGSGKDDVAAYAAALPAEHPPGARWCYASGTTNVVARIAGEAAGGTDAMRHLLHDRLFATLGMRSAVATFDAAGTFVGSSFVHATARDYARFGLLQLRDGTWDGRRVLPEGWADTARRPQAFDPERGEGYAWHWWTVPDGHGTFAASGYEGQRITVVPALDLVVVRLGKTPADRNPALADLQRRLVDAFTP
jgi:CubicO group peptidase (beta-lactamase class C family)